MKNNVQVREIHKHTKNPTRVSRTSIEIEELE